MPGSAPPRTRQGAGTAGGCCSPPCGASWNAPEPSSCCGCPPAWTRRWTAARHRALHAAPQGVLVVPPCAPSGRIVTACGGAAPRDPPLRLCSPRDATLTADGGRPGQRRAPPHRRRRADRALPGRPRRQNTPERYDPGAHGQRPARPGRSTGRRHRRGVCVRGRRRMDHPHVGHTQPRQTPALDDVLTRVLRALGPRCQPPRPASNHMPGTQTRPTSAGDAAAFARTGRWHPGNRPTATAHDKQCTRSPQYR